MQSHDLYAGALTLVMRHDLTLMAAREPPADDETRERRIEGPPPPSPPQGGATIRLAALDITSDPSGCFTLTGCARSARQAVDLLERLAASAALDGDTRSLCEQMCVRLLDHADHVA